METEIQSASSAQELEAHNALLDPEQARLVSNAAGGAQETMVMLNKHTQAMVNRMPHKNLTIVAKAGCSLGSKCFNA